MSCVQRKRNWHASVRVDEWKCVHWVLDGGTNTRWSGLKARFTPNPTVWWNISFRWDPPPPWFGCDGHCRLQLFCRHCGCKSYVWATWRQRHTVGPVMLITWYAHWLWVQHVVSTASQTLLCLKRVNNWLYPHVYYSDERWPVTWVMPLLRNTWCNSVMLYGTVQMHAEDF